MEYREKMTVSHEPTRGGTRLAEHSWINTVTQWYVAMHAHRRIGDGAVLMRIGAVDVVEQERG